MSEYTQKMETYQRKQFDQMDHDFSRIFSEGFPFNQKDKDEKGSPAESFQLPPDMQQPEMPCLCKSGCS
jgi:hypothetical protein